MRSVLALMLLFITACTHKRDVKLSITNTVSVPAQVAISVQDDEGRETEHQELLIPASQNGKHQNQDWGPYKVPTGHQVNVTWVAAGSSTTQTEPSLPVNKGGKETLSKNILLANVRLTSPEDSKTALEQLASNLKISGKETSRLVDVMPNLGALLVARVDGAGNISGIVDRIPVVQPVLSAGGAATYDEATVTTRKILSELAVNIPLYADIQSSMSTEGTYSVKWYLRQYPWDTSVSFINAVSNLGQQQKNAFAALLEMQPSNSKVFYISKMQVLDKGVFSVSKGQTDVVKTSGGAATVFTGQGEYYFDHRDAKVVDVGGYVYDVVYSLWGTRDAVLNYLKGGVANPPPAKPADPGVHDKLNNMLFPID